MRCGNGEDKSSLINESCPEIDSILFDSPTIEKVHVFLETSGSMAVLMPQSVNKVTSFQKIIPNILLRLDEATTMEFYSIVNSSKAPRKIKTKDAGSMINAGEFQWGASTSIPDMLDTIQRYQTEKTVSLFITDGIFSPSKGASKDTAQAINLISQKFHKIHSKNLVTCIISLKSEMGKEGTPYYMIINGSWANVKHARGKIIEAIDLYNKEYYEVFIGAPASSVYYSVIPYLENSGNWIAEACIDNRFLLLTNSEITSSPLEFWVGFDLSSLPYYTQDLAYLQSNLQLDFKHAEGEVIKIVDEISTSDVVDKAVSEKSTHFVKLRIHKLFEMKGEANFAIRYSRPLWISKFNGSQENERSTTAGLKNIITGIEDAYNYYNKDQYFVKNVTIVLEK